MRLAIEIFVILLLSTILGYVTSDFLDFIKGVLLYIVLITAGLFTYSSKVERDSRANVESIDDVIDDFIAAQTIIINCPCQKKRHSVFIRPNEELVLQCDECNNNYKVDVQYSPILITTPLEPDEVYEKLIKERAHNGKNE